MSYVFSSQNDILLALGVAIVVTGCGVTTIPNSIEAVPSNPPVARPLHSSVMALDIDRHRLYVANRESDTVAVIDLATEELVTQVSVGSDPRQIAVSQTNGDIMVTCMGSNEVCVVAPNELTVSRRLFVGDGPCGIVALSDTDELLVASSQAATVTAWRLSDFTHLRTWAVAKQPRGLAVAADRKKLLVTHFLTGQVTVIDLSSGRMTLISTGEDSNKAEHIVISPRGDFAYMPHIRSNTAQPHPTFDSTVFPVVSVIDLAEQRHMLGRRLALEIVDRVVNNPCDAAFDRNGTLLYVVHAGSDDVSVIDVDNRRSVAHLRVGANPLGIIIRQDGNQSERAYIYNALEPSVSVIDPGNFTVVKEIRLQPSSAPAAVRLGKRIFYTSRLPQVSKDHWMSCASCHFEGKQDGRTWSQTAGPRQTMSLGGVVDTFPLHWSADRDEVQDFEITFRELMGGTGFLEGEEPFPPLETSNAGRSVELDNLAAYVLSLAPPLNPNRLRDGTVSESASRGQIVFQSPQTQCVSCHPPPVFTDRMMHDVGTADGPDEHAGPLIDTPSLRGVFETAPYLHDGSAATLKDVLTTHNRSQRHGDTAHLSAVQIGDLIAYLESL